MKKTLVGPCVGRFHRACALTLCVMLASCSTSAIRRQQHQESISLWQAAGGPAVVSCSYPFELKAPAPSGSTVPQTYPSLRDFLPAATVAQAPIQECAVISGSDDAAQIAKASWGSLGYAPLHAWRPATAFIVWQWTSEVVMTPMPGMEKFYKYSGPPTTYETSNEFEKTSVAYGAWYLAYQRNPQGDEQTRRQGTGLYAMQGFRCAIRMRDFAAARRYWALALSSNPGSTAAYGLLALQSLFQGYFKIRNNDPDYLNIPQDIRRATWEAAGQRYSGRSMVQIEEAAQAGGLDKILAQESLDLPRLSVLYCPVFYPDFDPIPPIKPIPPALMDLNEWDVRLRIPANMLNSATQRATGITGKGK